MRRWGSVALADLAAPAAALARDGVVVNAQQAEVIHLLDAILRTTPECEAIYAPRGPLLCEGELWRDRIARRHDRAPRQRGRGAVLPR